MNSGSCFNIVGSKRVIPLQSIDVVVRIKGFVADVESTLCYKNTESGPIEAVYEFPMDDQSAVYRFEAKIEDRTIVAECQEKKQARDTYNEATRRGYTATLMEEHDSSSDIFRCLVGNLPPDTEARIIFAYVTELSLQPDGKLSFTLPTLLNPRYTPQGHALDTANVRNDLPLTSRPYAFKVKAFIMNTPKIVGVTSNKDDLDVQFDDTTKETSVTLVNPFVANHDLTFQVTYDEPQMPKVIVEKGQPDADGILKQDVVMINFFPHIEESSYSNKKEFIFVIDRSGSMAGSRINEAKESLLLFLKSLPQGCYFNIVGFGSRFEVLFQDGSREYSEESLAEACHHQQKMIANLGGTEILAPLLHIYSKPCITTHSRQMFLLTDGEVTNTQEVIDIVKKNASHTRVFAFGIGQGSSTSLIKGVARAGRGIAEFVMSGEALQPRVMKILKAAMQPSVTDIHLEWQFDGAAPKFYQVPRQLPQIFAGDRFISYAVFTESLNQSGKVYLKGKIDERILEYLLTFEENNTGEQTERSSVEEIQSSGDSLAIHRLAAKSEIKHLQDDDANGNKAVIILLSTAANIISCHTSMVGVDKDRKEVVTGNMVQKSSIGSENMFSMRSRQLPTQIFGISSSDPPPFPPPIMRCQPDYINVCLPVESTRECHIDRRCARKSMDEMPLRSPSLNSPAVARNSDNEVYLRCKKSYRAAPIPESTTMNKCADPSLGRQPQPLIDEDIYEAEFPIPKPPRGTPMPGRGKQPPSPVEDEIYEAEDYDMLFDDISTYRQKPPDSVPKADVLQQSGKPSRQTVFMNLVMFQTFCGSWKLTDQLAKELQLDLSMLKSSAPIKSEDAWATVLVLSFLRVKLPDKRDEWEVIARKAEQWLTGQGMEGHSLDELLEKAKNLLQ